MERCKAKLPFPDRCRELLCKERLPQRLFLYAFGLFIASVGTALALNANLGVSPIQAVPTVLSIATGLSLGTCTFLVLSIFTLLQIPLLRREFQWYQLIQLPFILLFGYLLDFSRFLLGDFHIPTYFGQQLMLWTSLLFMASGITIFMQAKLINMPPEALVVAIVRNIPNGTFHRVKIATDSILVALAILLSFSLLGGLYGVREGTLITAVFLGKFIYYANRLLSPALTKLGF